MGLGEKQIKNKKLLEKSQSWSCNIVTIFWAGGLDAGPSLATDHVTSLCLRVLILRGMVLEKINCVGLSCPTTPFERKRSHNLK